YVGTGSESMHGFLLARKHLCTSSILRSRARAIRRACAKCVHARHLAANAVVIRYSTSSASITTEAGASLHGVMAAWSMLNAALPCGDHLAHGNVWRNRPLSRPPCRHSMSCPNGQDMLT